MRKARPEILESAAASEPLAQISIQKVLIGLGVAALLTGGILSWFASTRPDGLEWSIEKILGKSELREPTEGIIPVLGAAQGKTTILPDYGFKAEESPSADSTGTGEGGEGEGWPAVSPGTTVAGIVGATMTLGLAVVVGLVLRRRGRGAPGG